jgi:hypothetical protein
MDDNKKAGNVIIELARNCPECSAGHTKTCTCVQQCGHVLCKGKAKK